MFENAKWITRHVWPLWTIPKVETLPPSPYIAKTFVVKKEVASVLFNVCALGQGAYFFNNERIPDSYIPSHPSNYERSVIYSTYDLTEKTKIGKNRVGIIIGNTRYGDPRAGYLISCPKTIAQIDIVYKDGEKETIVSDRSFKTAESHVLFSCSVCGEKHDANRYIENWCSPDFDDSNWDNANILAGAGGVLRPTDCPPRRVRARFKGKEIKKGLFDLEENIAGFANVKVKGKKGAEISVLYSEDLSADGTRAELIDVGGPYYPMVHRDVFVLSGNDDEFESFFSYHGFRYIYVEGEYEKLDLTALAVNTDIKITSSFCCDNETVNKIHNACTNSFLCCCQINMVDCPQREQDAWTGDGLLTAEAISMAFDAYDMYYEWMLKFKDDQLPNGKIPGLVPHFDAIASNYAIGIDWTSVIIHIPYYAYKYTGNIKIVETMWENMERAMCFYASLTDNYLLNTGLGDYLLVYPDWKGRCNIEITDTVFYKIAADMMFELALELNKDAKKYKELSQNITKAFRNKYVKDNNYTDNTLTGIISAIYAGFLEEGEIEFQIKKAFDIIKSDNGAINCGTHGLRLIFDVMSNLGYTQEIFDILMNDEVAGFAKSVNKDGLKTIPETFYYGTGNCDSSKNHQFKGTLDSWFFRYLAGIKVNGFGFDDIEINPHFVKGIDNLKAEALGIKVSYSKEKIEIQSPYDYTLKLNGSVKKYKAGNYSFNR